MKNINYKFWNLGTFVYQAKAPDHVVKRLLDEGNKKLESYNKSLAGHIKQQFLYDKETIIWFYNEMQDYWNSWRDKHCAFNGFINHHIDLHSYELWVNYMKKGEFNPLHTHSGDLSFVLYLDYPEELHKEAEAHESKSPPPGSISFNFTHTGSDRWFNHGSHSIPETGDLLIFPAQLNHMVLPFKSDVTRISVSGNLHIANKKELSENNGWFLSW